MVSVVRSLLLLAIATAGTTFAATIPGGSVLVSQSGDGVTFPSNDGSPAAVTVYKPTGARVTTIEIPRATLQFQGTIGGRLSLSADGKSVGLPGYLPTLSGSGDLSDRTDSQARRGYLTINATNGALSGPTQIKDLSGEAADSVAVDGDRAWLSGEDNLVYWHGQTDVVFNGGLPLDTIQPKGVRIFGERLYLAAQRPSQAGFIADFDGYPHGDDDQPRVIFDVNDPEDVAVSEDRDTFYVARSSGVVDVYRKDGGTWTVRYSFSTGGAQLRGVAVDFTGKNPVVYAIDSTRLWKAVDAGRNAALSQIAIAPNGRAFLGLAITPGSASADPQLTVTSRQKYTTSADLVTIRGTASDADGIRNVRIKRTKTGAYKRTRGTTTAWSYRARLQPGVNVFFVRATDGKGNFSPLARVRITRR